MFQTKNSGLDAYLGFIFIFRWWRGRRIRVGWIWWRRGVWTRRRTVFSFRFSFRLQFTSQFFILFLTKKFLHFFCSGLSESSNENFQGPLDKNLPIHRLIGPYNPDLYLTSVSIFACWYIHRTSGQVRDIFGTLHYSRKLVLVLPVSFYTLFF